MIIALTIKYYIGAKDAFICDYVYFKKYGGCQIDFRIFQQAKLLQEFFVVQCTHSILYYSNQKLIDAGRFVLCM